MNIKKYIALSLMISFFISFTIAQDVGTIMNTSVTLALQGVKDLKSGLDKVTQELFELDARERAKNENLDERYRQARNEIVRVINGIEETTSIISQSIERLAVYQVQMKSIIDEMNVLKTSSSSAKEYLSEYMNLLYKMQLELYGYEGEAINDLRLLITSNNINQTLVSSEITAAMTLQLNDLLSQAEVAEEKNLILLNRLGHLKQQAQLTLNSYRDEIEKLQQKKQYLLSFIELYKNEQIASSQRFNKVFTSKREVHLAIQIFLDEIVKKDYKSVEGIATKISQLSQLPDARNKDTIAQVARPVYPIEQILRYYNDPQFELSYGFKHQAIQIQAVQRSPVYAARDGVVYHTFDNMDSISRVMIVHQEGYVTTYQYLNQIIVQPGDVVTRGEII